MSPLVVRRARPPIAPRHRRRRSAGDDGRLALHHVQLVVINRSQSVRSAGQSVSSASIHSYHSRHSSVRRSAAAAAAFTLFVTQHLITSLRGSKWRVTSPGRDYCVNTQKRVRRGFLLLHNITVTTATIMSRSILCRFQTGKEE